MIGWQNLDRVAVPYAALRESLASGLLFFPVTPFTPNLDLNLESLRNHVDVSLRYDVGAAFVACGTGEFSALSIREYGQVVRTVVEQVAGRVPVIAGVGYGYGLSREFVTAAEESGAQGLLLLPPYLADGGQAGIGAHVRNLAAGTDLPLILYQREVARYDVGTCLDLLDCPNVIGLKDGTGNLESVNRLRLAMDGRWLIFNGAPTAELSASAFQGIGVENYSSAAFCFVPEVAAPFYRAFRERDVMTQDRLLRHFYLPLAEIRDRRPGYAVALIKAGMRIRGYDVGDVRPPLAPVASKDLKDLEHLIASALALASDLAP